MTIKSISLRKHLHTFKRTAEIRRGFDHKVYEVTMSSWNRAYRVLQENQPNAMPVEYRIDKFNVLNHSWAWNLGFSQLNK